MSHRDSIIKKNKELSKPMDIFNIGFVGAAGGGKPDQVTGVGVTPESSTELTVTWNALDATPAVSGYLVERSPNGSSSWTTVASSNSTTSFGDSGLSVYTLYYYRVSAINSIGTGDVSSVINARTLGTTPSQVTGLALTDNKPNVGIVWNTASGIPSVTYTLEHSLSSSFSSGITTKTSGGTGTSYTDSNVTQDVNHYYRVKAVNTFASGSYSTTATILIVASTIATTGATFSQSGGYDYYKWTSTSGGTVNSVGYQVQVFLVGGGGGHGAHSSGGGGAGGILITNSFTPSTGTLNVVVGSGGAGSDNGSANGTNSSFDGNVAGYGGGGGGRTIATRNGKSGAHGGGGAGGSADAGGGGGSGGSVLKSGVTAYATHGSRSGGSGVGHHGGGGGGGSSANGTSGIFDGGANNNLFTSGDGGSGTSISWGTVSGTYSTGGQGGAHLTQSNTGTVGAGGANTGHGAGNGSSWSGTNSSGGTGYAVIRHVT